MSKTYEFIKDCDAFYVLTLNNNFPTGRPFGAIMEYNNKLYLSTGTMKAVYQQLINNGNICIVALKPGTRDWIRIKGKAVECMDLTIKQKMLDTCPTLTKRFSYADCKAFALFEVTIIESYINNDNGAKKID